MSLTAPFALVPGLLAARQEAGNPARVRDLPFCSFSIHSVNRPRDASPSTSSEQQLLQSVQHRVWRRDVANVALDVRARGVWRCLLHVSVQSQWQGQTAFERKIPVNRQGAPPSPTTERSSFLIADLLVNPALDEVVKDGRTIKLEPKAMQLLVCLADRAGAVLSVENLLDLVWKDV